MKKIVVLVTALMLITSMVAFGEGLGVSVTDEVYTSDFLADGDLTVMNDVTAEVTDDVITFGVVGSSFLSPDLYLKSFVSVYEKVEFAKFGLDFYVKNANLFCIDDDFMYMNNQSYLKLNAKWKFVEGGYKFGYQPTFDGSFYVGPNVTLDLAPVVIDITGAIYYGVIADSMFDTELGNIEAELKATYTLNKLDVYGGARPTYDENVDGDREFGVSGFVGACYNF